MSLGTRPDVASRCLPAQQQAQEKEEEASTPCGELTLEVSTPVTDLKTYAASGTAPQYDVSEVAGSSDVVACADL